LHSTSVGKALSAYLPPKEIEALATNGFPKFTPRTITTLSRFRQELKRIREEGVAIDNEENTPGVRCIAAPIFGSDGSAIAAISLTGPVQHVTEETAAKVAERVKAAANQLTQAVGGHPPSAS